MSDRTSLSDSQTFFAQSRASHLGPQFPYVDNRKNRVSEGSRGVPVENDFLPSLHFLFSPLTPLPSFGDILFLLI